MQKSEFSIKINLSTATLMANHWCLWIETTPQLWMSSRFTYLYPFKHSLQVHTSRVASVTHFNLNNPSHYHCTCSADFCHTAIIPWRGKGKKATKEFLASSGYFSLCWGLILTSTAGLLRHGLTFLFSSVRKADTQTLLRLGFTVMLGNCFPWLCSLWSPSLKTFHSL